MKTAESEHAFGMQVSVDKRYQFKVHVTFEGDPDLLNTTWVFAQDSAAFQVRQCLHAIFQTLEVGP